MFVPTLLQEIHAPHATLFVRLFSEPELAWVTLGAVLPEILPMLRQESLRLVSGQLTDDDLGERFADLLFEVALEDGRPAFVRLLFEHKSWADGLTALQVAGYTLRIQEAQVQRPEQRGKLPLVLPVVVLHDPAGRPLPERLTDLLDVPEEVRAVVGSHTLDLHLLVDDLMALSFERVAARSSSPVYRLAVWLLRSRGVEPEARFEAYREAWSALVAAGRSGAISGLLHYAVYVGRDLSSVPLRAAYAADPRLGEEAMTYGERLIAEGVAKGHREGMKDGLTGVLLKQLTLRFGALPEAVHARLAAADSAALERWAERFVTAPDLASVFDDLEVRHGL